MNLVAFGKQQSQRIGGFTRHARVLIVKCSQSTIF
jgi:hypothetical protein